MTRPLPNTRRPSRSSPTTPKLHVNLGILLSNRKQIAEAIAHYRQALEAQPDYAPAHINLGNALAGQGQTGAAIACYREAVEIAPDSFEAHNNLGAALVGAGQLDEAIAQYQAALEIRPDHTGVRENLDMARSMRERLRAVLARRRELLRVRPKDAELLNDIAWLLATAPAASVRNGTEAVDLARRAVEFSGGKSPEILGTLAAACAEAGRFPEAVQTAHKAADLARQQNKPALAVSLEAKLRLYEAGTPLRESPFLPAKSGS